MRTEEELGGVLPRHPDMVLLAGTPYNAVEPPSRATRPERIMLHHLLAAVSLLALSVGQLGAAAPPQPRRDVEGIPLPFGAVSRIGSARFRHDYPADRAAWSSDGRFFAAGGMWRGLRLWDFPGGRSRL